MGTQLWRSASGTNMKGALVLILSLGVTATRGLQVWEDGKEYIYTQESGVHVGTTDYDSNASGFRTKADVKIQVSGNKLKVSVSNFRRATFNHPYPDNSWPYKQVNETKSTYLNVDDFVDAPFSFTLEHGLVHDIQVPTSAPFWLKNMMRAFASSIQIDLQKLQTDLQFTTKEKSIHGDCFVQYTYEKNEFADYHVVTKGVSHLKDCVNRRYRFFNNLNGYTCNADPTMEHKFLNVLQHPDHAQDYATAMLQSYTPTEPLFSETTSAFYLVPIGGETFKIEKLFSSGNVIVQPFTEEGVSHIAISNTTLILKEVKASTDDISVESTETLDNLEFEFEDVHTWDADVDLKKREHVFRTGFSIDEDQSSFKHSLEQAIENFVTQMQKHKLQYTTQDTIDKMHKEGIQKVFSFLYPLDYDTLKSVKEKYFSDATTETGVYRKNVFTEILPMAGTKPAAVLIKEMVENKEFKTDADTARIITSVPFHIRKPTKSLVKLYEELLSFGESAETFTKMAIPLSFAHLVRRTCELTSPQPFQEVVNTNNKYSQEKRDCLEQLLNPYVDQFFQKFDALNVENHEELNHYLMVLHNFRWGKVFDHLKPVVLGQTKHKHQYNIRTLAIFAMTPVLLEKGQTKEILLPIFLDTHDNHEVRIAAFDILMKQGGVDSTIMSKIMKKMVVEKDNEVFNYVYTAFEKFAETSYEPCNVNLKEYAKYFLKFWYHHMWTRPSYKFGISKTYGKTFKKDKYGYAGTFEFHTVGSHKSTSPLSIMFDVRSQHFGHHTMQILGGYIRIQGLAKNLVNKVREMTMFNPQQWKIDELKNILFSQMQVRERADVPVEVDVIFMMKDEVVFQRHYTEQSVRPGGNLYSLFMDLVALGKDYNINHQRGLMFGTIFYEQPTETGVPMMYMSGITTIASLQAKVNRGSDTGVILRTVDYKIQLHTQATNALGVFDLGSKSVYGITQDRVYNHRFGSKVTGMVNLLKKQIKVTVERPEYGEPLSMMMHSHTKLGAMSNKFTSHHTELKKSCPTCQYEYTLSKGTHHKKDRIFLQTDNEEWGFHVEGKYFDCEVHEAGSFGQMFNVIAQAFSPFTKQPKDLLTTVGMGLRQVHSFLLYYPRAESCGVGLRWSQSKFNPVEKIDIILNGQVKTLSRPDVLQNGKKIAVDGEIIFHGAVDRVHHITATYSYEPFMIKNDFALKISRIPFRLNSKEYSAFSVCLDYHSRYPFDPKEEFHLDFTTDQKVKADLSLSWGHHTSCNNNPGKVHVVAEHQTTQEAKKSLKSKWFYQACQHDMASPEWKDTVYPSTDACIYTAIDLYTLRHFKWTANFQSLEPWMVSTYRKVETLLKTGLFPFWKIEFDNSLSRQADFLYSTSHIDTYSPVVVVEQVFHPEEETFDLTIQTNKDKNVFHNVPDVFNWNSEPYLTLKSSFIPLLKSSHISSFFLTLQSNKLVSSCLATTRSIYTFDNVTYPYDMHNCWTLVSSHCAPTPSYAVFMKKSSIFAKASIPKMDVEVNVGGHTVGIKPVTHAKFEVTIEGQQINIGEHETYYWPSNQKLGRSDEIPSNFKIKIYRLQKTFFIESYLNVIVTTDGNYVKVLAPSHVKGQHCGMCGDFNGDHEHEFIHPQMCELSSGSEMAAAWAWERNDSNCPAKPVCEYSEKLLYPRQTR